MKSVKRQRSARAVALKTNKTRHDNTLYSRLNHNEDGCIIIIMQRLHEDDLVGHVLGQEDWVHLNLPALAEERQIFDINAAWVKPYRITREIGDALHPERQSVAYLINMRDNVIGKHQFAAQFQQSPAPLGGGIVKFEWFRRYDELPEKDLTRCLQSWDTASKAGENNDFSVCTTWHQYKNRIYLVNIFRKKLEYPELLKEVQRQAELYNPNIVLIEDKGSGIQLAQELKRLKLPVQSINPELDKATRMQVQTPKIETGNVYIPEEAHWLHDFENEVTRFPRGKFDDQIDSMSQALAWIHERNRRVVGFSKKHMEDIARQSRRPRRPDMRW